MPKPPIKPLLSEVRILYEVVLYRYTTEEGVELTGEASLMLERAERSAVALITRDFAFRVQYSG